MADSVLAAIRAQIAKGVALQAAVDEYAPVSSEANRIDCYLTDYLAEQEDRASRLEISPNHLRELRRCVRDEGAFAWWSGASIYEIDAMAIADWRRWLSRERSLSPKSVRNIPGYFRTFVAWLHRLDLIDRVPAFPAVPVPEHAPTILSGTTERAIPDRIPFERRGAFLAACHGVRPGELRALDAGDVEEREGVPGLRIRRAIKGPNSTAPLAHAGQPRRLARHGAPIPPWRPGRSPLGDPQDRRTARTRNSPQRPPRTKRDLAAPGVPSCAAGAGGPWFETVNQTAFRRWGVLGPRLGVTAAFPGPCGRRGLATAVGRGAARTLLTAPVTPSEAG
jgi:hypothetical protein